MTRPDRARVELRRTRAIELRAAGHDYDSIAERLGYASRAGAWKAVEKGLRANTTAAVEELRDLEMCRLDAMQVAVWDEAVNGNLAAANVVIKIINRRARLLGLLPDRTKVPASPQSETVVVDPSQLVSSVVS